MSIKINWTDTGASKYEVYESTDKANVYLPEKLVSTLTGTTEYVKTNDIAGVVYYYGVRAVYATGNIDCPVFEAFRPMDTGPGLGGLVKGNHKRGCFQGLTGEEAAAQLPSIPSLQAALTALLIPATAAKIAASPSPVTWNKIIHDGKILYSGRSRSIINSTVNLTLVDQTEVTNALETLKDTIIENNGRRYKHKHGTYDMMRLYGFSNVNTKVGMAPQETAEFPRYTGSESAPASGVTNFVAKDKTYNFSSTSNVGAEGSAVGIVRYFTYLELVSE